LNTVMAVKRGAMAPLGGLECVASRFTAVSRQLWSKPEVAAFPFSRIGVPKVTAVRKLG
jgi:hypothetical protein